MAVKLLPKPSIHIGSFAIAAPFYQAKEVTFAARSLLALASNCRTHGINLYKATSNEAIERILGLSHGQFMRAKKLLRDKNLLDYEGRPGSYQHLIDRWESCTGEKWEWEI